MRIGTNPVKDNNSVTVENYHRVVIPVYIPNFEGYFAEAFDIFKMCLDSVLLTVHSKTRITIYNNNCHPLVKEYIDAQYRAHPAIDQVFHSKENLGKINAILSAVKGNLEPLITITDADVLFKKDWQVEVEKLFMAFPEAGTIAPVPASKTYRSHTQNVWGKYFLTGKMQFEDVQDPDGLIKFDRSLGNTKALYSAINIKKYLTVQAQNGTKACVGCGHFVATLRREVFDKGTSSPAFIKIQGGVEAVFIDKPNDELGFLRIATSGNYAFHMGNTKEPWMYEEFALLSHYSPAEALLEGQLPKAKGVSIFEYYLGKVLGYLLAKEYFNKLFLSFLGMKEKY
jgi:hypothetical protein